MDKEKWGVHEAHCCAIHGCKYGDEDCPVVNGETYQEYPCESCSDDFGTQFVLITGSKSCSESFIGSYGKIIKYAYGDKWTIELKARTETKGYLRQMISAKDFEIVS